MSKIPLINPIEFTAYGVPIGIFCNDENLKSKIKKVIQIAVPNKFVFGNNIRHQHIFKIECKASSDRITIQKNDDDETVYTDENSFLDYLASQVRITVAEFASTNVFIHAGAIGWNGSGIIIPGKSYSGKTTLVSELIKIGAEYYSDEYAVLDENGYLHPYPKMLSMRGILNDWDQVDTAPEDFGAKIGIKPLPVRMILVTKYNKKAKWKPKLTTPGEAVLEILQHTIPIRNKPEFVLNVLKKTVSRAIIAKSERGAAQEFAPFFLEYLETTLN